MLKKIYYLYRSGYLEEEGASKLANMLNKLKNAMPKLDTFNLDIA